MSRDNEKYLVIALLALVMVLFLPENWGANIPYIGGIIGVASKAVSTTIEHQVLALCVAGMVMTFIEWPRHTEPLVALLIGLMIGRFVH